MQLYQLHKPNLYKKVIPAFFVPEPGAAINHFREKIPTPHLQRKSRLSDSGHLFKIPEFYSG